MSVGNSYQLICNTSDFAIKILELEKDGSHKFKRFLSHLTHSTKNFIYARKSIRKLGLGSLLDMITLCTYLLLVNYNIKGTNE